jgi:hypothetical protein
VAGDHEELALAVAAYGLAGSRRRLPSMCLNPADWTVMFGEVCARRLVGSFSTLSGTRRFL